MIVMIWYGTHTYTCTKQVQCVSHIHTHTHTITHAHTYQWYMMLHSISWGLWELSSSKTRTPSLSQNELQHDHRLSLAWNPAKDSLLLTHHIMSAFRWSTFQHFRSDNLCRSHQIADSYIQRFFCMKKTFSDFNISSRLSHVTVYGHPIINDSKVITRLSR